MSSLLINSTIDMFQQRTVWQSRWLWLRSPSQPQSLKRCSQDKSDHNRRNRCCFSLESLESHKPRTLHIEMLLKLVCLSAAKCCSKCQGTKSRMTLTLSTFSATTTSVWKSLILTSRYLKTQPSHKAAI